MEKPKNFNEDCELYFIRNDGYFSCANKFTPDEDFNCKDCMWNKKQKRR